MNTNFEHNTVEMQTLEFEWLELISDLHLSTSRYDTIDDLFNHTKLWWEFAHKFHAFSERYQSLALVPIQSKIQCKQGCDACCKHSPQSVEPFESFLLYSELRKRDDFTEIIFKCFERHQALNRIINSGISPLLEADTGDEEDVWLHKYFKLNIPCPMLKNSQCSVYEFRPQSCQLFYSISNPSLCESEGVLLKENQNFLANLPDSIEEMLGKLSSKFEKLDVPDGLFASLIWWNQHEGLFELS